ncbi:hypothetical protein BD626DRAFT_579536, partial [Schizophyllum amplum]
MPPVRALDIPEVLSIVLDAIADYEIYDATQMGQESYRWRCHCLAQAARVNWLWHGIASARLWENVDLISVLKLLPPDAWHFYDYFRFGKCRMGLMSVQESALQRSRWPEYWNHRWRDIKDPVFTLTRPISEGEWCSLLRYTRHVKTLRLNFRTGAATKEGPEFDNVAFDQETVYAAIATKPPQVRIFPKLKTVIVRALCNEVAALEHVYASASSFLSVIALPSAASGILRLKLWYCEDSEDMYMNWGRLIYACKRVLTHERATRPERGTCLQTDGRACMLTEIIMVNETVREMAYQKLEPDEVCEETRPPALDLKGSLLQPMELPDARDEDYLGEGEGSVEWEDDEEEGEGEDDNVGDDDDDDDDDNSDDDSQREEYDREDDATLAQHLRPCHALRRLETTMLGPESLRVIAELPHLILLALSSYQPGIFLADYSPEVSEFTDTPFPSLRALHIHGESFVNTLSNIFSLRRDLQWPLEELHLNGILYSPLSLHRTTTLINRHIRTDTLRSLRLTLDDVPSSDRPFDCLTPLLEFFHLEELDIRGSNVLNDFWHSTALTTEQVRTIAISFPDIRKLGLGLSAPL